MYEPLSVKISGRCEIVKFGSSNVRRMSITEEENTKEDLQTQLPVDENNMMGLEDVSVVDIEYNVMPGLGEKERDEGTKGK